MYCGHDVEFNIFTKDGSWLPPYGEHMKMDVFEGIHPDVSNYEFSTKPHASLTTLIKETQKRIGKLQYALDGAELSFIPVNQLPIEVFQYPHQYGCRPSLNLFEDKGPSREELENFAQKDSRRPCGGHIHLSDYNMFGVPDMDYLSFVTQFAEYQDEENVKLREKKLTKLKKHRCWKNYQKKTLRLELEFLSFSYAASLVYANTYGIGAEEMAKLESERRLRYGVPGDNRPKLYTDENGKTLQGVELRSPSPMWILVDTESDDYRDFEYRLTNLISMSPALIKESAIRNQALKDFPSYSTNIYLANFQGLQIAEIDWTPDELLPIVDRKVIQSAYPKTDLSLFSLQAGYGARTTILKTVHNKTGPKIQTGIKRQRKVLV